MCFPRRRFGFRYSTAPFFIPYNGILLDPLREVTNETRRMVQQAALLQALLESLQQRYALVVMEQPPVLADLRPFVWNAWHCQPQYTVVISLHSEEEMLTAVEKDQRRKIRRLQEQNFQLRESEDGELLYNLLEQSYRKHQRVPPLPRSHFLPFVRKLLNQKLARLFVLVNKNEPLAALLMLEDFPRSYALFSGRVLRSDASGTELFLIWQALRYYRERRFQEVYLLGAMVPSIAKIKLELGGRLVRYDRFHYFRNRWVQFLFNVGTSYLGRKRKIT